METDEWLQILSQHPVFKGCDNNNNDDDDGKQFVKRLAQDTEPYEKMAIRGTDLFVVIGNEIRWVNLKVCKDAYIKAMSRKNNNNNNNEAGADALRSVPWYRLCCEALGFDIQKITCNGSGKLMAVIGKQNTVVVVLPPPASARKIPRQSGAFTTVRDEPDSEDGDGVWVDCRSMEIGTPKKSAGSGAIRKRSMQMGLQSGLNNTLSTQRVVDILWHPLSANNSHVLVLYSNGVIKMFDVSNDVDFPEQTFSLLAGAARGFSVSHAVSFCLGSACVPGWARTTLYVVTNTGEVYSLCPVIPRMCSIEREWVEELLKAADLEVREWQAEEYETVDKIYTPPELVDARQAAKWVQRILDLDTKAQIKGDLLHLVLPDHMLSSPSAQGPYMLQPDPTSVTNSNGYNSDGSNWSGSDDYRDSSDEVLDSDACDIAYIGTEGIGIVAVAYCDAHVEIFADIEPVIAKWTDNSQRKSSIASLRGGSSAHKRSLPLLVTLTSVDLAVSPISNATGGSGALSAGKGSQQRSKQTIRYKGPVALIADTMSSSTFFALHAQGVHRIDTQKWCALLEKAMDVQPGENGDKSDSNGAVECLINSLNGRSKCDNDGHSKGIIKELQRSVSCIIHTNPYRSQSAIPVIGAVVLDDIYLSYSMMALVAPGRLIGVSLPIIAMDEGLSDSDDGDDDDAVSGPNNADDGAQKRRINLSLGAKDVVYVPRLSMPLYEPPQKRNSGNESLAVQQPRLVLQREDKNSNSNGEITKEKLELLGEVVGQLRRQLGHISTAHEAMQQRLELQVQEHERQCNKLAGISGGFEQHMEQMTKSQERLEKLREGNQALGIRIDQVLRQLIDYYQPELSDAEREFAREVGVMLLRVEGPDGYKERVERLQETAKRLIGKRYQQQQLRRSQGWDDKAEVDSKEPASPPQLSRMAIQSIEKSLDHEHNALKDTCERISSLHIRVNGIVSDNLQQSGE